MTIMADSLGNIGKRRMTMKGNPHIGIIIHVIRLGSQIGRFAFPNREIEKTKNEMVGRSEFPNREMHSIEKFYSVANREICTKIIRRSLQDRETLHGYYTMTPLVSLMAHGLCLVIKLFFIHYPSPSLLNLLMLQVQQYCFPDPPTYWEGQDYKQISIRSPGNKTEKKSTPILNIVTDKIKRNLDG